MCCVQSGNCVLLLEGVCRVRVERLVPALHGDADYDAVAVTRLEPPHPSGLSSGPNTRGLATTDRSSSSASNPLRNISSPTIISSIATGIGAANGGQGGKHAVATTNGVAAAQPLHPSQQSQAAAGSSEANEAALQEMGRQLKATTRALLRLLSRAPSALPTRRLQDLLVRGLGLLCTQAMG
jgi:hypothetical protein